MGNFISEVTNFVGWIGEKVCAIINWFSSVVQLVGDIVIAYLEKQKERIIKADDPKTFGECLAAKKYRNEIDKIAKEKEKRLSERDRNLLDQLL